VQEERAGQVSELMLEVEVEVMQTQLQGPGKQRWSRLRKVRQGTPVLQAADVLHPWAQCSHMMLRRRCQRMGKVSKFCWRASVHHGDTTSAFVGDSQAKLRQQLCSFCCLQQRSGCVLGSGA
jgi:hypothetical protein